MPTAADSAPPSGSPPQDKAAASRNKRKYSADPPSGELGIFELEYPMTPEEFMAAEKAALAAVAEHGDNLDNVCYTHTCTGFHTAAEGLLESQRHVNWTDLNEVQLEEVLLKSLDVTFDNAVTMITAMGYSEAVGRATVVRTAKQYCWRDDLSVFGDVVVDVLKTQGVPREGACVDYMRQVERAALHDLVSYIIEERPFYSVGEVMFCLLMSDMNVARACTMIYTRAPVPDVAAQVRAQPVSITNPQTGALSRGKLIHMTPNSFNPLAVGVDSSTMVAFPNLSSSKPSASGNMQHVISNMKPKEHTAAVPDCSEGQPFVAAVTHSSKDGKPFTSKRGSSKRDSSHRQKFVSFDKSSRAMGSKVSLRSVKHSSLGSAALDRKSRQFTDSSTNGLKGSSKLGKGFSAVLTGSELSLDFSFSAEAFSTLSLDTNRTTSSNPVPAANTDLSVSLSSSTDVSVPSPDQNSNVEAKDPSRKINFSYHQDRNAWIPRYKKDEIVMILVQRQEEMQTHIQGWTDWAQEKVMQVTRTLAKEKEELQSLRKEKDELVRLQDERHTLEESTRKKLLEMESAISRANASARRRDAENSQLRIQLEAANRHAVESETKFEAFSRKDEKTLKRSQSWESQRAVLQDELAAGKTKLSRVLQQLQHAKEKKDQLLVITVLCLPIHNLHV
jgi:hypothetical protein